MLSDLLSPPALPSTPRPRPDLLTPSYVLERRDEWGNVCQRGVLGSLDVRGPDSGHVLRHTQVDDRVVAAHMRTIRDRGGVRDPLLLAAPDLGGLTECVTDTTARPPDLHLATPDEGELRLWACDPRWTTLAPPLGPVLLADGHHRLEAARRLYRARPGPTTGRLPAMVVDHGRHPLRLDATHRVVAGLDPRRAAQSAERFARVRLRPRSVALQPPQRGSFLLTGQGLTWEISAVSPVLLARRLRWLPSEWAESDAAVCDHVVIPALCRDQGIEPDVGYSAGRPPPGRTGLVLPAPTWNQLWSAAGGHGMPAHSTTLGPGPLPDLLAYLG
ncbi:DUF1015 family protein [Streptomyces spiramenti]|uniref:DUF1015 family protein n=1 Tax=Streptomyces spiramenti TaxID=2720606 RepID=UPI001ADD8488